MGSVLVTGSQGFVGPHLVRALRDAGHIVSCRDRKLGHELLTDTLTSWDRVYHLAAATDAQSSDMTRMLADNVDVTYRLARRYGDKLVFASSSMAAYPTTPYGISKRAAEEIVLYYGGAAVRFCNLYGAGGHGVLETWAKQDELTIYGTGEQVRTYAHVSRAVAAMVDAEPMDKIILQGRTFTLRGLAQHFYPDKPIRFLPQRRNDVIEGRQKKTWI